MSDNPYQSPLCYGPRRKWLTKERAVWLWFKSAEICIWL